MGAVFRVEHVEDGHVAALKTVREVGQLNLLGLRREIEALGRVEHPGVVRILDHGVHAGLPWCAVELISGGDLQRRLDETWAARPERPQVAMGRLDEALRLLQQLCEPLAWIHGLGMVHGDLKPANVLLDDDGRPRLLDFGLAERGGPGLGRESLRVGSAGTGSLAWMAPERFKGAVIDARADLYALGCVAYQLLTGLLPFQAPGEAVDPFRRLREAPEPPSRWVDGVPEALDALLLDLLATERRDRLGHATDAARRFGEIAGAPEPRRGPEPADYLYWPQFVGREQPLERLMDALYALEDGDGSACFVVGESGVGKTRLVGEVATAAAAQEMRLILSECAPVSLSGAAAPLAAFQPVLVELLDLGRERGPAWCEDVLGDAGRILSAVEPRLATLPGVAERPEPPALSPQAARERLREALLEALLRYAEEGEPLVLVLDDVQWADALSLDVLGALLRQGLEGQPLLVLATVREEELEAPLEALMGLSGVQRVDLSRMGAEPIGQMIADMLALRGPPQELVGVLVEQSEGNPFFVSEYLRAALDSGLLRRDAAGTWRIRDRELVSEQVRELDAPGSLRQLVAHRLGLLAPPARACAEAASVIGLSFPQELLLGALEQDASAALESVQALLRRQVLRSEEDGRLRFTHGKLRELAYEGIEGAHRGGLHRQVAGAYEGLYDGEERARQAPELAHHWRQAGERDKATGYLEQAGDAALGAAAYESAVGFFRQALELGEAEPGPRTARWESQLGDALFASARLDEAELRTRSALTRLGFSTPEGTLGWALVLMAALLGRLLPGRSAPPQERARLLAAAAADHRLSYIYYFTEDVLPMMALAIRSINTAERCGAEQADPRLYAQLGVIAATSGAWGVARRYLDRALALSELRGDPGGRACALYHECLMEIYRGHWADAERVGLAAVAETRALGDSQETELAETMVLHVELYTGRLTASLERCAELRRISQARGNAQHEAWGCYAGARALLIRREFAQALADLERAAALLDGIMDSVSHYITLGMRARALTELERFDEAEALVDEALRMLDAGVSAVVTAFHGHLGLSVALHRLAGARGFEAIAPRFKKVQRATTVHQLSYPVAQPSAAYAKGLYEQARGRPAAARRHLERSAQRAEALAMPPYALEAGRALLELELVTGEDAAGWRERVSAWEQALS